MESEFGMIAAPMKANVTKPNMTLFRTWNTSEIEEKKGPRAAWTSVEALMIQYLHWGLGNAAPMLSS
jgi:hypothetical protein